MGKHGHALCKTFCSKKITQSINIHANKSKVWHSRHLPNLKRKVQSNFQECASIACNMMRDMTGALGCELGCGIA